MVQALQKDPITGRFLPGNAGQIAYPQPVTALRRVLHQALTPAEIQNVMRQFYALTMGDGDHVEEIRTLKKLMHDHDAKVRLEAATKLLQVRQEAANLLMNRIFGYPRESHFSQFEEVKKLAINIQAVQNMTGDQLNSVIEQIDVKEASAASDV